MADTTSLVNDHPNESEELEQFLTDKPSADKSANRAYLYLWCIPTTDPTNIFVRSPKCDNYTRTLIIFVSAITLPITLYSVLMATDSCDWAMCIAHVLGITIITYVIILLGFAATCYIIMFVYNSYKQINLEIDAEPPIPNEQIDTYTIGDVTYYLFMYLFVTTNPDNIFVKSPTCNLAMRTVITCGISGISTIIIIACAFNTIFNQIHFSDDNGWATFGSILITLLVTIVVGMLITFGIMCILYGINFVIKGQFEVRAELSEKTSLLSKA
jgi:hypothetical protein